MQRRFHRKACIAHEVLRTARQVNGIGGGKPGIPLPPVLIAVQILNGALLPILLVFIVKLASNKEIMGKHAIGPVYRVLAWGTVVVITTAVILMFGTSFF